MTTFDSNDTARIRIREPGSAADLFDSNAFNLSSGSRIKLAAVDYFGPGGADLRVVLITTAGSTPFPNEDFPHAVRIANVFRDATAIDVYLEDPSAGLDAPEGTAEFQDVALGSVTNRLQLPADAYQIFVTTAGDATDVLDETESLGLEPGQNSTLVVTRSASDADPVAAFSIEDDLRILPSGPQLRFLNASVNAGTVDVYVLAPGATLDTTLLPRFFNIPASEQRTSPLASGSYDVYITEVASSVVLLGPEVITVGDPGTYTAILADDGDAEEQLLLFDAFLP